MSPGPSCGSSSTASQIACTWSRSSLVVDVSIRPVADLDRVGPAGDLDDRCGAPSRSAAAKRSGSMVAEVMTTLRSGRARQELLEVAEEEVDVEAALVRLVDDDRVVAAQQPVALDLGQQDAVGHHLDQRVVAGLVGEPDLVADRLAELDAELLGDALGDGAGGDPARLGVPDLPVDAAAQLEADLGELGGLAASRSRRRRRRPGGRGSPPRCRPGAALTGSSGG